MKKIAILPFIITTQIAQAQGSCCMKSSADRKFAAFTEDRAFVRSHEEPLPFVLSDPMGKDVTFATPDGGNSTAYEIRKSGSKKYILVIHEWWGLNDYIRKESETIYATLGDVNIITLDLYDGK